MLRRVIGTVLGGFEFKGFGGFAKLSWGDCELSCGSYGIIAIWHTCPIGGLELRNARGARFWTWEEVGERFLNRSKAMPVS